MSSFTLLACRFEADLEPPWQDWLTRHFAFDLPELPLRHTVRVSQYRRPAESEALLHATSIRLQHHRVGLFEADPVFWLGGLEGGVRLEVSPSASEIGLWGQGPSLAETLHLAVCEVLRVAGLLPLHAAAASQEDKAWILLGASGSGKTTTLLQALTTGWNPVAEDFCVFDANSHLVCGLDGGLRLWPDTLEVLRQHFPGIRAEFREGKWFVPYSAMGLSTHPARAFRLTVLNPKAALGSPLSARDVALALWQAAGVPLSRIGRAQAGLLVSSLARLPWSRWRREAEGNPFADVF
ncbi:MAG: hypothetical protein IVW51_15155 [Thermaceae bacterium]|nr:hypothetical protein [Thermaceae bacterium]